MSIKESALAAVTSIVQGDFIRVVTSAGASRRISFANLLELLNIPKFVSASVSIPTGAPAGAYNLGALSSIFGIPNFTQGRVVSLTFIVEGGNTTYLGNVVSFLIYGNNVYVNLASPVSTGTIPMQLKCQYN